MRESFLVWLKVGALAFGGGNVALGTIRQEFVERRGWIDEDDFARTWAVCQASPGINLLCLAILVGRRLSGTGGAVASLLGMTLPGAVVTLALAAGFAEARGVPAVRASMRAVVPATAGLGLASVIRAGLPLLREGWSRRKTLRAATAALPVLGFGGLLVGLPPVGLLMGGALAGAGIWWIGGEERGGR